MPPSVKIPRLVLDLLGDQKLNVLQSGGNVEYQSVKETTITEALEFYGLFCVDAERHPGNEDSV